MKRKNITRPALITGVILLVPFLAMQFTSEVNWDLADFLVAGVLIFGGGLVYEFLAKKINKKYRVITAIVIAALVWFLLAELAVGIFTNWGS